MLPALTFLDTCLRNVSALIKKRGKKKGDAAPLERMAVAQLKVLLRQKGLPVSGRKDELIERLTNAYTGPKPKAWQSL